MARKNDILDIYTKEVESISGDELDSGAGCVCCLKLCFQIPHIIVFVAVSFGFA